MGARQTDACTVRREVAWRVDLVGIGRGVTVRELWREERKRDRERQRKEGGKGEAQISLPWQEKGEIGVGSVS